MNHDDDPPNFDDDPPEDDALPESDAEASSVEDFLMALPEAEFTEVSSEDVQKGHPSQTAGQAGAQVGRAGLANSFAAAVALPADASSREFKEAVQALREQFEDRQPYNTMLCDQLAMRGIPPSGSNILEIGAWGTKAVVLADVRGWYANLAGRLSAQHARIPEVARRQSNQLFEQLWQVAVQTASEPLNTLQQEVVGLQARLDTQAQTLRAQIQAAQIERERSQEFRKHLEDRVAQYELAATTDQKRISELENSIAVAALTHRDALLEQERQHQEALRKQIDDAHRMQEGLHAERVNLVAERDRTALLMRQQQIDFESRLMAKDAQALEDRRAHALALDRARQDVREANARADAKILEANKLREEKFSLREQISTLLIDKAKLDKKINQLQEQLSQAGQISKEIENKSSEK